MLPLAPASTGRSLYGSSLPGWCPAAGAHRRADHLHSYSSKHCCFILRLRAAAKPQGRDSDDIWRQLGSLADKYVTGTTQHSAASSRSARGSVPVQAVHILLTAIFCVWLASSSSSMFPDVLKALTLEHNTSKWWAAVTDGFCSHSSQLLARNLFFGYIFGRVVNNTESGGAVWLTFLLSATGGSIASWLLLPRRVPLHGCGSTGAMFGLVAMATVFNRQKHWHWQRLFEMLVLLPFVCQQLLAGHAGMNQWCLLYGVKMGAWVPLLGGLAGAAVAAGLLAAARTVLQAAQQQQQQQQRLLKSAGGSGGQQQLPVDDDPVKLLLTQALKQLLKRVM